MASNKSHTAPSGPPPGVDEISPDDYFVKNENFRVWLREERGKYLDELSTERSHHLFSKFVKAWNRGQLSSSVYKPTLATTASSHTAYKWSFASKVSKSDQLALEEARSKVTADTHILSLPTSRSSGPSSAKRSYGPSMPSPADAHFYAEEAAEATAAQASLSRKRARAEERDRLDDVLGVSKSDLVGKEGQLERKRARAEGDRAFRNARSDDTGGLDIQEDILMGSSAADSFRARIAQRDAARERTEARRQAVRDERAGAGPGGANERLNSIREKDKQTMDMFKNLAKQRFG